jgi:hypothetical protein
MNIKCKIPTAIRSVGNKQIGIVLKKEIVELSGFKEKDNINVTVLENGSLLIEKRK